MSWVWCGVLQHAAVCCIVCITVCCSLLQRAAVCCGVLQCVTVCCRLLQCVAVYYSVLQRQKLTPKDSFHSCHSFRAHDRCGFGAACHMWDMTRLRVGHNSFTCGTWLIHMCDMTHSYVDKPHSQVGHDSFICGTWLIHLCDMTHSYVRHDSFICDMLHMKLCHAGVVLLWDGFG